MAVIIGSARSDERGKLTGGAVGDQKQTSSTNDTKGEISMQPFYVHSKGWDILRAKDANVAKKLAQAMKDLCNNPNVGYDQNGRLGVVTNGIHSRVKTEADCSSSVRACIIAATGKDVGNFTTLNEKNTLVKSGLFSYIGKYVSQTKTPLQTGDVLVTCAKGHTVIVVSSDIVVNVNTNVYYPKYNGNSASIVTALGAVGERDTSYKHRSLIAKANGVTNYSGTPAQNTSLIALLKNGKLIKA